MADEFERLRQEEEQRQKARKAAGHPAPWRWKPGRIGHSGTYPDGILVDANGVELLRREADDRPPPELEWVGVLLASAPEMEALLRELAPAANHLAFGMEVAGHSGAPLIHGSVLRARALLARIDAAKAGT